jgi:hypothetical protein
LRCKETKKLTLICFDRDNFMDINNIQLTPAAVTALFKNLLYSEESKQVERPERVKEEKSAFKYLGQNNKKILLLVNYSDAVFLPDKQLDFLTSILSACKLNLADVAIINSANPADINYKVLAKELQIQHAILFDISPASLSLPVDFPAYQVQSFSNCTYLHSDSLEALAADKELKTKLWLCLKKIFGL